jgi:hypothetical protein
MGDFVWLYTGSKWTWWIGESAGMSERSPEIVKAGVAWIDCALAGISRLRK